MVLKQVASVILVCYILSFASCQKVIKLEAPAYQRKVSIQSMIEPDSLPVVYLNRTVPYFDSSINFSTLVIRQAVVRISDGVTADFLHFDSTYDRLYCEYSYFYKGNIPIRENTSYSLTIYDGTDSYAASASTADLNDVIIDSVVYTPNFSDLYGEHEGVIVYFKDVIYQPNYYRYEMDRYVDTATKKAEVRIASPCLGRDSVYVEELGRSVYKDIGQNDSQIKIVVEPAYSHKQGTKGYVRIQSIDKNAYDFFDQLDKQKLAQYNPFIEPVFLREGQFGAKAIGYFSAMVRSNGYLFFYPE